MDFTGLSIHSISFFLQTALAVGDVKDVKEIAKESRIKLQVDILNQFAINERSSDTNFKLKILADFSTEYSSCHQDAQLEPFQFFSN